MLIGITDTIRLHDTDINKKCIPNEQGIQAIIYLIKNKKLAHESDI